MTDNTLPSDTDDLEKKFLTEISEYLNRGSFFEAYNKCTEALERYPNNKKIAEYSVIILLNTGAIAEAKRIILPILEDIFENYDQSISPDLLKFSSGCNVKFAELAAKVFKGGWISSQDSRDLNISRILYVYNFNEQKCLFSGAEASSLAWLLGDDQQADKLAAQVIKLFHKKTIKDPLDYAAAGIAYTILKDTEMSIQALKQAQEQITTTYSITVDLLHHFKLMYRNGFKISKSIFDALIPPTIVVFTGQMIDTPDQREKKFLPEMETFVKEKIKEKIDQIDAKIGYSSASCGSDILFIECMLERGAEVNIILPFEQEDFLKTNVKHAGPRWETRFRNCLQQAKKVQFATEEKYLGHDMLYRFGNMILHGIAEMRGNFLLSPPHLIAVWDSMPNSLIGGASDFIDHWSDITTLHIIDLDEIKENYLQNFQKTVLPPHLNTIREKHKPIGDKISDKIPRIIKTMLFTDIAGYTRLKEESIPGFLNFINELKIKMEELAPNPLSINTWGDSIFVVMENASDLAEYSLTLNELVTELSQHTKGIPELGVRISLHAGPVYEAMDPFRGMLNYYGGHINRAARLEPVTVIGEIYTTEQFISFLIAEQSNKRSEAFQRGQPFIEKFACKYVGNVSLAKGFGPQPIYHLKRS